MVPGKLERLIGVNMKIMLQKTYCQEQPAVIQSIVKTNTEKEILPRERFNLAPRQLPLTLLEVRENIDVKTDDVNACLQASMDGGIDLSEITIKSPGLETVFLNLTGRQLRE